MTPMIDVTFLLLIFFMCTLNFRTLEGRLAAYLPDDVGVNPTDAVPDEKVRITLEVKQAGARTDPRTGGTKLGRGRFEFDGTRVLEYTVGPVKTRDRRVLAQRLELLHRRAPERPVTIDARAGTVYGDVVRVLDAALAAGFERITFVGGPAEPPR
jgi:biopolymer transport protein ExbD